MAAVWPISPLAGQKPPCALQTTFLNPKAAELGSTRAARCWRPTSAVQRPIESDQAASREGLIFTLWKNSACVVDQVDPGSRVKLAVDRHGASCLLMSISVWVGPKLRSTDLQPPNWDETPADVAGRFERRPGSVAPESGWFAGFGRPARVPPETGATRAPTGWPEVPCLQLTQVNSRCGRNGRSGMWLSSVDSRAGCRVGGERFSSSTSCAAF